MGKKFFRKQLKRFRRHKPKLLIAGALLIVACAVYAGYMNSQRLRVNPATYQNILHLIGKAESNNNYNAHFGNAGNSSIIFTDMTVAEVLQWQQNFIQQGSPSSAVGKYQFINTTLDGLVRQLGIRRDQKFSAELQDQFAIALLERRGAVEYVNNELTREEFAANLAKEWASLPKTIGNNPQASYYAGDGLNKSRVSVEELLKSIEPISAQ